jgi:hypothetical protein
MATAFCLYDPGHALHLDQPKENLEISICGQQHSGLVELVPHPDPRHGVLQDGLVDLSLLSLGLHFELLNDCLVSLVLHTEPLDNLHVQCGVLDGHVLHAELC